MKVLSSILFALVFLFASCSEDDLTGQESSIEFEGVYAGFINCEGTLSEDNRANFTIIVTKGSTSDYILEFGDDVTFPGNVEDNKLVVDRQTINEGQGFDEITMEVEISLVDNNRYSMEMFHEVDDEGSSDCLIDLLKN